MKATLEKTPIKSSRIHEHHPLRALKQPELPHEASGFAPVIQRQAICPCDGGCPRCRVTIQPKLIVGQPDDLYEREADQVADHIMRMELPDLAASQPALHESDDLHLQRSCFGCQEKDEEEEILQTKADSAAAPEITPVFEFQLQALRGGGEPLPERTRNFFEPRFGQDFSQVRIHTGGRAAEAARAVNARAFTVGKDVVFGAEEWAPQSFEGGKIIAHELTHILQQSSEGSVIRRIIHFDPPTYKRENPIGRVLHDENFQTTPTVNSDPLPNNFSQAGQLVLDAFRPKKLSYNPKAKECTFQDFEVTVSANVIIPTKPADGSWTLNVSLSDISNSRTREACRDRTSIPVVMTGKPSSVAVVAWIEKNEQEHVDDLKNLYLKYLKPHFDWLLSLKVNSDHGEKCLAVLLSTLQDEDKDRIPVRGFLTDLNEAVRKRDEAGKHTLSSVIREKNNCRGVEIESSKK